MKYYKIISMITGGILTLLFVGCGGASKIDASGGSTTTATTASSGTNPTAKNYSPTGLQAMTNDDDERILVRWNALKTSNEEVSYQLYYGTNNPPTEKVKVRSTKKEIEVFPKAAVYYVAVSSVVNGIESAKSQSISVTTNRSYISSNLMVQANHESVQVSWDAVTGATLYRLYHGTTNPPTAFLEVSTTNSAIASLNNGTLYYFAVSALVNNIERAKSTVRTATPHVPTVALNDTGITWGGDSSDTNNADCSSDIMAEQDCHYGRDAQAANATLLKVGSGHGGFDFTKLGEDGSVLTIQDATWSDSGNETAGTKWSCVKDNHTNLIWEIKTNDNGIHNKDHTYKWGGITALGRDHALRKGNYDDGWNSLVNRTNTQSLCGTSDWRVPTHKELNSIINHNRSYPAIDTNYFPNTQNGWYWSSSPYSAYNNYSAWMVDFRDGHDYYLHRGKKLPVRLVHGR